MKPSAFRKTLILFLLPLFLLSSQTTSPVQPASDTITFTAVGDFGATNHTAAVLNTIGTSGAAFHLALGDLSYGALRPESSWCDYVKSRVGSTFPFELIAGNHDSGQSASEGNINNFVTCLPDRLKRFTGTYGKEYYFDTPSTAPLARIILISPRIDFVTDGAYSYVYGSAHYNWVKNAIDGARAAGIPWVIVGMHKFCIAVAGHTCDVEPALYDLLFSKKVDLILQAHNHNYQRSKQLALSASCTSLAGGSFNSSCVVDDGADDRYTKDAGSVFLIAGMGGQALYDINNTDPDFGYFAKLMAANANPTYGIVRLTLSNTQLTSEFVRASGGSFSDHFTISKPAAMPTATPTFTRQPPTPTGQPPTSTPSGNTTYAKDTFTRNVTDSWGSAEIGGSYTMEGLAAHFDVDGSAGTMHVPLPGYSRSAILPNVLRQDLDFTFRVKTDKLAAGSNQSAYFIGRRMATNTQYWGQIRITPNRTVYLLALRVVNGGQTEIAPPVLVNGLTHTANSYIWVRGQMIGTNPTTIRLKAWADGQSEPANWLYTATDSTPDLQASGAVGLRALIPNVTNAPIVFTFDDFLVTAP
jgi:hypothetical protein